MTLPTVPHVKLFEDVAIHVANANHDVILYAVQNAVTRFTRDSDILRTTQTTRAKLTDPADAESPKVWSFLHRGYDFGQLIGIWLGDHVDAEAESFAHLVERRIVVESDDSFSMRALEEFRDEPVTCEFSLVVKRDALEFPRVIYQRYNRALVACAMTDLMEHLAVPGANWEDKYSTELVRAMNDLAGPRTGKVLMSAGPYSGLHY